MIEREFVRLEAAGATLACLSGEQGARAPAGLFPAEALGLSRCPTDS